MTLSQLRQKISLIESEHEYQMKKDIQNAEQEFINQYKYINQGDPIVLDDEFLGYFDHIDLVYGCVELGYYTEEGNNDSYRSVLTTLVDGLRLAEPSEVA